MITGKRDNRGWIVIHKDQERSTSADLSTSFEHVNLLLNHDMLNVEVRPDPTTGVASVEIPFDVLLSMLDQIGYEVLHKDNPALKLRE